MLKQQFFVFGPSGSKENFQIPQEINLLFVVCLQKSDLIRLEGLFLLDNNSVYWQLKFIDRKEQEKKCTRWQPFWKYEWVSRSTSK